ncbi:MAG: PKD domain-containing protein [Chloroflexi bacterium]|nr:PKD domain-containing protein [Chloroflexota bacterium]MCI0575677.1 PKD domain-containing protein [Chloroflexota bacterium]MCI0647520.1 PKD domain-containing protein [Chloroflexota bacterium]MCI0730831.1 PKD domain-containing protein [Chloroflexota bacterium]
MLLRTRFLIVALLVGLSLLATLWLGLVGAAAPAGSLRFVDENGSPLANTTIWLLCYASDDPNPPLLADLPMPTNALGEPAAALPAGCSHLAALRQLHEQPSGKPGHGPAYRVYATSWPAGGSVPLAASGDITITAGQPLVLFEVVASLAWQPAAGSAYLGELREGLYQALAYLYDLSEGQMAIGPVQLYAGGRGWDTADLRILAANDYRPAAFIGGIVQAPISYTAGNGAETVFAPARIFLGRFWDGLDATDPISGSWSQPAAYRTLVHEWSHYALFLYDEYQQKEAGGGKVSTYCVCLSLPQGACDASAMSYHYTANEWWLPAVHGQPAVCLDTDQWQAHGQADWPTLLDWGSIQGLGDTWLVTPTTLLPGPALGLANDLFGRPPGARGYLPFIRRPGAAPPVALEPTINVALDEEVAGLPGLARLYPQVYVFGAAAGGSPQRLSYQGTTTGPYTPPDGLGQIRLFGVQSGDRARIFVEQYAIAGEPGGRFVYPQPGGGDPALANGQTLQVITGTWTASLDVAYQMAGSRLNTLTLTLASPESLGTPPLAQLCLPAAASGCPTGQAWQQTMQASGAITWTATFVAPANSELPDHALIRIQASGQRELLRWFQVAGGVGPGHMHGFAPLRDGLLMVDAISPVPGTENRVVFMPAADYNALVTPLPAGFEGVVGLPLDVDVLLPGGSPRSTLLGDATLPVSVTLTFFYNQKTLDRLGVSETDLRLLRFDRATTTWQPVATAGQDDFLDWIASQPVNQDGIYAVGWATIQPVQANFIGNPTNGQAPLLVTFVNLSTGDYTNSLWDFGDGFTSTLEHPSHVYQFPGIYTVALMVSGPGGTDTLIRPNYIFVLPPRGVMRTED